MKMLQYIRRPEDVLPPHAAYIERRFNQPFPESSIWGRLPIGTERWYGDWTSGYIKSEALQLYETRYAPAPLRPRGGHSHAGEEQAYYLVQGRARVLLNDCVAEMSAGSFCYAPAGTYHGFHAIGDEPAYMLDIHGYHYDGKVMKLELSEQRVPPDEGFESAGVPDAEGAYYVVSGVATITVGDESATVGAGGTAYLPRGVAHGYRNPGPRDLVLLTVVNRDVPT
jgi:mannose-6-phosphate isomerase-like protein (cupin superfamily)